MGNPKNSLYVMCSFKAYVCFCASCTESPLACWIAICERSQDIDLRDVALQDLQQDSPCERFMIEDVELACQQRPLQITSKDIACVILFFVF